MKSRQEKKYSFDNRARTFEQSNWVTDTNLLEQIRQIINKYHPKILLDLGIGTGIVEAGINNRIKVTGIDISSQMIAVCKERHPSFELIIGDIKQIQKIFQERIFDMIFSRATLGHMKIFSVLKDAKKLLSEKGKVFLCESISYSVKDIKNQIQFHNLLHPGHIDFPTETQFIKMFKELRFSILYKEVVYTKCDVRSLFASLNASEKREKTIMNFFLGLTEDNRKVWDIRVSDKELFYTRPWLLVIAEKSRS